MRKILLAFSLFVFGIMSAFGFAPPALAAETVTIIVSGDTASAENQPGWMFNRDVTTSTPYEFNTDKARIGNGSLYILPIGSNASDKMIAENFLRADMGTINSISYDFMIGSGGLATQEEQFYMNVYANYGSSDENKFYDCRYNILPTTGSTSNFTPVTFDPTANYLVTTRNTSPVIPCPSSPAAMGSDAFVRAITINVGDTSASDTGLDGYLDNVVVNLDSGITTYDFEPVISPNSKDDCKNGNWANYESPVSFKNQGDCVSFMSRTKTYNLNSADMDGIEIPTKEGSIYKLTISGTWANRPGETVDAECAQFSSTFPWLNAILGGVYSPNLLDTQVNNEFIAWGQCDSVNHTYTTWVNGSGDPIMMRVFDGDTTTGDLIPEWYGDNVGSLKVTVQNH